MFEIELVTFIDYKAANDYNQLSYEDRRQMSIQDLIAVANAERAVSPKPMIIVMFWTILSTSCTNFCPLLPMVIVIVTADAGGKNKNTIISVGVLWEWYTIRQFLLYDINSKIITVNIFWFQMMLGSNHNGIE